MEQEAIQRIYSLEEKVLATGDADMIATWVNSKHRIIFIICVRNSGVMVMYINISALMIPHMMHIFIT